MGRRRLHRHKGVKIFRCHQEGTVQSPQEISSAEQETSRFQMIIPATGTRAIVQHRMEVLKRLGGQSQCWGPAGQARTGEQGGLVPSAASSTSNAPPVFQCPAAHLLEGYMIISGGIHLLACLSTLGHFPDGRLATEVRENGSDGQGSALTERNKDLF